LIGCIGVLFCWSMDAGSLVLLIRCWVLNHFYMPCVHKGFYLVFQALGKPFF
jgi:hypothetical protein